MSFASNFEPILLKHIACKSHYAASNRTYIIPTVEPHNKEALSNETNPYAIPL